MGYYQKMEGRDCIDLPYGVSTIDTGYLRPGFDASYLLVERGQAAVVDVGTSFSTPRILRTLTDKNIAPEAVRYVMVTHVHLDHAGGAGTLMHHLPKAQLVVHPRGAPHLIDPTKLIAGATAVYGEAHFRALYGEIVPVAAERVIAAPDNFELNMNGRPLLFLDTPGHARHHYCIYDAASRGIFSGDTFGLSYREFDTDQGPFIFPTTTPVQFDPEAMRASIERLLSFNPQRLYLTHYGCVDEVPRLAVQLKTLLDAMEQLACSVAGEQDRHGALTAALYGLLLQSLRDHGCALPEDRIRTLLAPDVELNAQGLAIWLDKLP